MIGVVFTFLDRGWFMMSDTESITVYRTSAVRRIKKVKSKQVEDAWCVIIMLKDGIRDGNLTELVPTKRTGPSASSSRRDDWYLLRPKFTRARARTSPCR